VQISEYTSTESQQGSGLFYNKKFYLYLTELAEVRRERKGNGREEKREKSYENVFLPFFGCFAIQ